MTLEFLSLPSHTVSRFSPSETGSTGRWVPLKISNWLSCSSKTRNMGRFLCLSGQNGGFREISGRVGGGDGVIIVDHGSRRKESNLMLNEFVEMFKHKTGYEIVEPAHMELAEPSIGDAFKSCIQQGACRIIVSPFFLFPGRHWHQDIPSLTAEAAKEHQGVSYIITAPLGLHELLVAHAKGSWAISLFSLTFEGVGSTVQESDLVELSSEKNFRELGFRSAEDVVDDRIKHCLRHVAGDADECAICAGTGKCRLY